MRWSVVGWGRRLAVVWWGLGFGLVWWVRRWCGGGVSFQCGGDVGLVRCGLRGRLRLGDASARYGVVVVREEEGGFGSLGDKVGVGEVRQGQKARQLKLVG